MLLAGCAWLPSSGPSANEIDDQAEQHKFVMVNVDNSVVAALAAQPAPAFETLFGKNAVPPPQTIQVGDTVQINIWEAGSGSTLFTAAPSISLTGGLPATSAQGAIIPPQVVQPGGTMAIPFAGRVVVAGRTPQQVEQTIRDSLTKKASNPQVLVSVTKSYFNTATVTGEVASGARIPLSAQGDRVLDVIAASGLKNPSYDTKVRLTRNGQSAIVPFTTLLKAPNENIYVWPGDVIAAIYEPTYFNIYGASGKVAQIGFEQEDVFLSDALGKASGLQDSLADPSGVYLLRFEPRDMVPTITPAPPPPGDLVPVVYRFNFHELHAYFLARQFRMKAGDMIYIADSRSHNLQELFALVGTVTSPIITTATVSSAVGK